MNQAGVLFKDTVDVEKVLVVGGTILLFIALGYKVLKVIIRSIIEKIELFVDFKNRSEIEEEKRRTKELLKKYEIETDDIADNEKRTFSKML